MNEFDLLQPLRSHPIYSLAGDLARYVGVEQDFIQFAEFLSLAAGRMAMPINLEIVSEHCTVDMYIAHRVLDLLPDQVQWADTNGKFRDLEGNKFKDVAVILVQASRSFRHFAERTTRSVREDGGLPSLWRISDRSLAITGDQSTLRLMTPHARRELKNFGDAFAGGPILGSSQKLTELLRRLPASHHYSCNFRAQYEGVLAPLFMLVLERLQQVFAAIRISMDDSPDKTEAVLPIDYRAARAMLTHLPLTPADRQLSAGSLVTAETVFEQVSKDEHQYSLADRSSEGNKWFSRENARKWTGLGYNTVKDHLGELENAVILRSTRPERDRGRGQPIHYRFDPQAAPPFQSQNPFDGLHDLAEDACPH